MWRMKPLNMCDGGGGGAMAPTMDAASISMESVAGTDTFTPAARVQAMMLG